MRLVHVITLALLTVPVGAQQTPRLLSQQESIRVRSKIALVIGNAKYKESELKNPENDARAVAGTLRELGFEVNEKVNLTRREMGQAIDQFTRKLQRDDFGFFYFAGHGVQVDQENFLVPIDFTADGDADVQYEAYSASQVRDKMERSGARIRVLVLDACRNNPFRRVRSATGGLAVMQSAAEGTLIAFATGDNNVASDNAREENGLYTKHLIPALRSTELALDEMFKRVKDEVYRESRGKQFPFVYDGIAGGRFYFAGVPPAAQPGGRPSVPASGPAPGPAPAPVSSSAPTPAPARPAGPSADVALQVELAYWNSIDRNDPDALRQYLSQYPDGRFADIAKRTLSGPRTNAGAAPVQPAAPAVELPPPVQKSRGHQIMERVYQAGGGDRLLAIRDYETEASLTMIGPAGRIPMTLYTATNMNGMSYSRLQSPAGQMVAGFDGTRAWYSEATGSRWGTPKETAASKETLIRNSVYMIREFQKPGWRVDVMPSAPLQQPAGVVQCEVVTVTHEATGLQTMLWIDPSTYYILGASYTGEFLGVSGVINEINWDFREVQGIMVSHQSLLGVNGNPMMQGSVTSMRFNPGVPASRYRFPQR